MANEVQKITITAALSPDYQAAYKAAADTMKSADAQLKALEKENESLIKIQKLGAQAAEERAQGDLKAAAKSDAAYEKLKRAIEAAGGSVEDIDGQLAKLAERRKGLIALSDAAKQQATFGKLANEIKRLEAATKGVTDKSNPMVFALKRAREEAQKMGIELNKSTKQPSRLFGALSEKVKGFKDSLKTVPGPVGGLVSSIDGLLPKLVGAVGLVAGFAAVGIAAAKATKAVIGFGKDSIQVGDELAKLSGALGIDVESYQKLEYAMERGGASASVFKDGMKTLVQRMEEVKNGSKGTAEMFTRLGISVRDVKTMNPEEMMLRLSDAFKKEGDSAKVAKTASDLFGGEGYRLASAAKVGSKGLVELGEELESLGGVMTEEQTAMAETGADTMTNLQRSLGAAKTQIGTQVMPILIDGMQSLIDLLKENKELISDIATASGVAVKGLFKAMEGGIYLLKTFTGWIKAGQDGFAEFLLASERGLTSFWNWLSGGWDSLVAWVESIPDMVSTGIASAIDWTESAIGEAWKWLVEKKDAVVGWFESLPDLIADCVASAWDWLKSEAGTIWSSIRTWFANLWNNIVDDISSSPIVGDLLQNLKVDVPQTAPGGSYGGVTINNTIDARGAAPGTARAVSRAVTMGNDSAYQTMREGFSQARELQYSGVAR